MPSTRVKLLNFFSERFGMKVAKIRMRKLVTASTRGNFGSSWYSSLRKCKASVPRILRFSPSHFSILGGLLAAPSKRLTCSMCGFYGNLYTSGESPLPKIWSRHEYSFGSRHPSRLLHMISRQRVQESARCFRLLVVART